YRPVDAGYLLVQVQYAAEFELGIAERFRQFAHARRRDVLALQIIFPLVCRFLPDFRRDHREFLIVTRIALVQAHAIRFGRFSNRTVEAAVLPAVRRRYLEQSIAR